MILIADGGSTKCDWSCYEMPGGKKVHSFLTKGMNPTYVESHEIRRLLKENPEIACVSDQVKEVFFFGSGCGNPFYQDLMKKILLEIFNKSDLVRVFSDIEGAVFSCTNLPGVVGILGTGSNICYFDGKRIELRIPSLGYALMDQGGGNHMGRELLKAFYFGQLPNEVNELLRSRFNLDVDFVKTKLYSGDGASAYLASFADFIIQNEDNGEFSHIIEHALNEFFNLSVVPFQKELDTVPLHLVGSIAYYTSNYIKKICDQRGIMLGNIVQRPVEGIFNNISTIRTYNH